MYRLSRPRINGQQTETWYVVWQAGGRSHRASTRTTDRLEAERFLASFTATLARPPEEFDLNELADAYESDRQAAGKRMKSIRAALRPIRIHFGRYSPGQISPEIVRQYSQNRHRYSGKSRPGPVQPSTIDKELRFLRQVLAFGVSEGWMAAAPKIRAPGHNPPRNRFLTRAEYEVLREHASAHLRLFLSLAINTGQRKAAILELKWSQIDLERGQVWYTQTTHNKRRAVVPINGELRADLDEAKALAQTVYVIEWRGEKVTDIKRAWQRACERAGVRDATIHDLRRTCASWLLMKGATFAQVAAVLGDSEEVVRKHYAQWSPDFLPVHLLDGGA